MNIIDIILVVILLYGLIRGFFRGFFIELASLIAFVAGIYGAIYFSHIISDILFEKINWSPKIVTLVSFAITFIIIAFTISLAGKMLTKVASLAALGILNKMIGAGFGLLKIAFITSVIIMFFATTNEAINIVEDETLETSILYSPVKAIAPIFLPSILKEAREIDIPEINNSKQEETATFL